MEEFIPTTFRMDVMEEIEDFFAQQEGKKPKHISTTFTLMQQHNTSSTGFRFLHRL